MLDFEEWKLNRLKSIIQYNIKGQTRIMIKDNMESFWEAQTLNKILKGQDT